MSICIVAGGTGGHIYPALSIARRLNKKNIDIKWAGSRNRLEKKILSNYRIDFNGFDIYRNKEDKLWFIKNILTMYKISRYFNKNNITKIFSTGGYISFYFLLVAVIRRIPIYLFEPNVLPGRVTKWFAKRAKKVFVGFEETKKHLTRGNIEVSGIPVRKKIKNSRNGNKNYILIFGGSQGSLSLNNTTEELIEEGYFKSKNLNLLWIAGKRNFKKLIKRYGGYDNIKLFDYVSDMGDIYRKTGLAITRAGALTIAELIESRTPAILIPFPHAKDNHQLHNAKIIKNSRGAEIVEEDKNLKRNLMKKIDFFMKDDNLKKYKKNIESIRFDSPEKKILKELL